MSIYNDGLEGVVLEYKLIPRAFKQKERFKLYHRYWVPEYKGIIKIINVEYIEDVEYYFFKYDNLKLDACTSYPIYHEGIYELLHNYNNLEDVDIIGSEESFTGAEIRFWFVMHNWENYKKYKQLEEYLKYNTPYSITDNKRYYIIKEKSKITFVEDTRKL